MVKIPRKVFTLEFMQEAVRLVDSGQRISEAVRTLALLSKRCRTGSRRIGLAS